MWRGKDSIDCLSVSELEIRYGGERIQLIVYQCLSWSLNMEGKGSLSVLSLLGSVVCACAEHNSQKLFPSVARRL